MKFSASGNSRGHSSGKSKSKSSRGTRRGPSTGLIVFLCIMALLIGGGAFGYFTINKEISGDRGGEPVDIILDVPEGAYAADVAQMLKDEGVIGSVNVFKVYLRVFGGASGFTQGRHAVRSDMHYDELIAELSSTTHDDTRPTFTMTFPEGYTCLSMAMAFEDRGFCTIQEFLDACNNDVFDVSFYDQISSDPRKFCKLEGFLYPDTYIFYEDASVHEVIQKMLENFETKVLTPEIVAQIEQSQYTFEEVIIFASIIQKESLPGVEREVAGVFNNRMQPNSGFDKLETCTTNDFINGVLVYYYGSLGSVPSGMVAAYDTYNYEWFPVGAVANPAVEMVEAALNPNETPYYFFCTNVDTGEFFWAVTDAEHEYNKRLAGITG